MVIGKISSQERITLPKVARQTFGLKAGQSVAFVVNNGELTLLPLKYTLFSFEGSVEVKGEQDFGAVRNSVKQQQSKRIKED